MASIVIISPREKNPPLETTSFRIRMALHGVIAVGSALEARGHRVRIFCELSGARVDWEIVRRADYVCFSFLSFCAKRAYAMADRVRQECKLPVIMGGSHPSVMPEDCLNHCDYVVRNEGEQALAELIEALENGNDPTPIKGLTFRDAQGRLIHNEDQPMNADFSRPLNLDLIPEYGTRGFWWNLKDALDNGMPRVPMPVVQASRGCPENCKFCVVKYQLGSRYRKRPIEVVLNEIEQYGKRFQTPYFMFVDNDMSVDPQFTKTLLLTILERYGTSLRPYVFSRIDIYKNDELLRILEQFDHATLGVGVESLSDDSLRDLNKRQSREDIFTAIAALRRYKISVNGLFMFGTEYDTPETIRQTVDYCIESGFFSVGLFAIYDFPGRESLLGQPQMIADHLFIHRDWRYYNLSFAVNYPRLMRPSQLQAGIFEGYKRFNDRSPDSMYQFMPTRRTAMKYLEYLRRVERPFYDAHDRRLEEKVAGRTLADMDAEVPIRVSQAEIYLETANFLARNLIRPISWKLLRGMMFSALTAKRQP
ncbi:MAG TPA: radical SAM protein [bacterium]|nr:radical SAM protein [bacterium]